MPTSDSPAGTPPPEAILIEASLDADQAGAPAAWAALVACPVVEIHTAGAAPGVGPAQAGCAAVVQGYTPAGKRAPVPLAAARLALSVTLAPAGADAGGRAALAGVALGLGVLARLAAVGWSSPQVLLWTNHRAAVPSAAGVEEEPADLGGWVRHQQHLLRWAVPGGVRVEWLPPGEGEGAALELALAAAFPAGPAALARYRLLHERRAPHPEDTRLAAPAQPPLETDYTLVLGAAPAVGALATTPVYRLWARDGRSRRGSAPPTAAGPDTDAAAWAALHAALTDLLARITRRRQAPAVYSLTVYSSREPLVAALRATAPGAPASRRQAQALLARFASARVLWQPAPLLAAWLAADE